MDFIIGTAGHIDHGKTALIKIMTGIDADRLREEKERGITIVLGYAYLTTPTGEKIGIIDVPGHERFIHTMLAGVTGIDLVLFVVAADDGIMPQTHEHLDIINLLNIQHGIVVITKKDLVDDARIESVQASLVDLLQGTSLEGSPIVAVSSQTGEGIPELKELILMTLSRLPAKSDDYLFRLPIDRVFSMPGFGTIITGTVISGQINEGDSVTIIPGNIKSKVRGIQIHKTAATSVKTGHRAALNLPDAPKDSLHRGQWVCSCIASKPTSRFDALIELLPRIPKSLPHVSRVRIHIGTAETFAHLIHLKPAGITPGMKTYCQLILDDSIHAVWKDRFIIRSANAEDTIGGGIVINPLAVPHRHNQDMTASLGRLSQPQMDVVLMEFIHLSNVRGRTLSELSALMNVKSSILQETIVGMNGILCQKTEGGTIYFSQTAVDDFKSRLLKYVCDYHRLHPTEYGMDLETLRQMQASMVASTMYRLWIQELVQQKKLITSGNLVADYYHQVTYSAVEEQIRKSILDLYHQHASSPPRLSELEELLHQDHSAIIKVFKSLVQQGELVRISSEVYLCKTDFVSMYQQIVAYGKSHPPFKATDIRDLLQSSRKLIIPLLEFLDQKGITVRTGDFRRLK